MNGVDEDDTIWADMVRTVTNANASDRDSGDTSSAVPASDVNDVHTDAGEDAPTLSTMPITTSSSPPVVVQHVDSQCREADYVQCTVCNQKFDPGNEAGRYDCWYQKGTVEDRYRILIPAGHVPPGYEPDVYLLGTATLSTKALSYIKSQDPKRATRLAQNTFTAKYCDGEAKQATAASLTIELLRYYRYCNVTLRAVDTVLHNMAHDPVWRNASATGRHSAQLLTKTMATFAPELCFTSLGTEIWVRPG